MYFQTAISGDGTGERTDRAIVASGLGSRIPVDFGLKKGAYAPTRLIAFIVFTYPRMRSTRFKL